MDWELYERYRATLVLTGIGVLSFLLLAFQRFSPVQHIKAGLAWVLLPTERLVSGSTLPAARTSGQLPAETSPQTRSDGLFQNRLGEDQTRALLGYREENKRLRELLNLKTERWPSSVAANVVSRDPRRWFQDVLLDKGTQDGIAVDDAVVVPSANREILVGRISETDPHVSTVLLLEDSLSSVAAKVEGQAEEDGVVEGTNSHNLYMRYLSRDNHPRIGDTVVTAGLGNFPEGILIGWIEDIGLDNRQLFQEARLRPAITQQTLRRVLVLVEKD